MLVSLGDATGRKIVGPGVSSIVLYERPDSYDHRRAHVSRKPGGSGDKPPIWDWLVVNADGRGWLLHPRWTKRKWEITPLEDAAALLGTVPAKGVGRSDGPGTYRRATATYTDAMLAPAEAGTLGRCRASRRRRHLRRRHPRRRSHPRRRGRHLQQHPRWRRHGCMLVLMVPLPPPLPQKIAPAEAGQVQHHPRWRGPACCLIGEAGQS